MSPVPLGERRNTTLTSYLGWVAEDGQGELQGGGVRRRQGQCCRE